jgi:hypothetical protein
MGVEVHAGNRPDLKAAATIIYRIPKQSRVTADRGMIPKASGKSCLKRGALPAHSKEAMPKTNQVPHPEPSRVPKQMAGGALLCRAKKLQTPGNPL